MGSRTDTAIYHAGELHRSRGQGHQRRSEPAGQIARDGKAVRSGAQDCLDDVRPLRFRAPLRSTSDEAMAKFVMTLGSPYGQGIAHHSKPAAANAADRSCRTKQNDREDRHGSTWETRAADDA